MAIVEINLRPSERDLRWFGLLLLVFFGLIGGIWAWRSGSLAGPTALWLGATLVCAIYYGIRPLRRPIYVGWMYVVYPIGWTISHLLFATIYFLIMTPIGLIRRLWRRDPLERRFESEARTYWAERRNPEPSRYFRQF